MRTYVRVREYGYTIAEHDGERPWPVREQRHEIVQLDDDAKFYENGQLIDTHASASRSS
jgi:hypothetical protein